MIMIMFNATIVTSLFLVSAALATPSVEPRVKRRATGRQSNVIQAVEGGASDASGPVQYSTHWAGAVLVEAADTFTVVTGTFTVPVLYGSGSASAWVGIDGATCNNAILQAGLSITNIGGKPLYNSWYEWYPDYSHGFSGMNLSAGHVVKVTVNASTSTSGTVTIENKTTRLAVSEHINSSSALCRKDAEWIVEDFQVNGSIVKFADFGKVVFSNAVATKSNGKLVGPANATIIDIKQNNKTLTSVSVRQSTVTVKYV